MQQNVQKRDVTRNFLALTGDFVFFSIGFAFFDPLVVVPAFVKEFTDSEFLVGILSAIRTLIVTAPQLWAASILVAQPRKKMVLIVSSVIGRLPIFIVALATLWWGENTYMVVDCCISGIRRGVLHFRRIQWCILACINR